MLVALVLLSLLVDAASAVANVDVLLRHALNQAHYTRNLPNDALEVPGNLHLDGILHELGSVPRREWSRQPSSEAAAPAWPTLPPLPPRNRTEPRTECEADIFAMVDSIVMKVTKPNDTYNNEFFSTVVLPAQDASGKPGAGILYGHFALTGLYSQCLKINFEGRTKDIKMNFFRAFYDIGFKPMATKGACSPGLMFSLDLCLPDSCSSAQLWDVMLRGAPKETSSICGVQKDNDYTSPTVAGTYIVGIIMAILLAIAIVSGFFDFYIHPHIHGHPLTKGLPYRMFHAFSFYTNVREVFTVGKSKEGQIGAVHCIRFFSMCWVITGHLMGVYLGFSTNPVDVGNVIKETWTGFLVNAYFSVDSFFFLSGLLLAFVFFKGVKKNRSQALSPISWVMFYVHRILRLSPPYYFAIFFYTFVFTTWLYNMPAFMMPANPGGGDVCRTNWWINILYLHNYIDHEHQCYLISWYLATDLQIFLFTPLILIPLVISPFLGVGIAFAMFAISTAANIFEVFHYYFPPSDLDMGQRDPRAEDQTLNTYTMMMYDAPWIRCQVYIIGMLVGWFLQMKGTRMRINRVVNLVLWLLSGTMMLAVVLGLHDWVNGTQMDLGWRALYSSLSKPAWGIGLSWMVISSYYGYGGAINAFMSWNIFVPLGRLSYSAYLIHFFIIMYYIGLSWVPKTYFSFTEAALSTLIPCIFITYALAVVWTAVFEIPFAKIEMMLIGNLRFGSRPPQTAPAASEAQKTSSAIQDPEKFGEEITKPLEAQNGGVSERF